MGLCAASTSKFNKVEPNNLTGEDLKKYQELAAVNTEFQDLKIEGFDSSIENMIDSMAVSGSTIYLFHPHTVSVLKTAEKIDESLPVNNFAASLAVFFIDSSLAVGFSTDQINLIKDLKVVDSLAAQPLYKLGHRGRILQSGRFIYFNTGSLQLMEIDMDATKDQLKLSAKCIQEDVISFDFAPGSSDPVVVNKEGLMKFRNKVLRVDRVPADSHFFHHFLICWLNATRFVVTTNGLQFEGVPPRADYIRNDYFLVSSDMQLVDSLTKKVKASSLAIEELFVKHLETGPMILGMNPSAAEIQVLSVISDKLQLVRVISWSGNPCNCKYLSLGKKSMLISSQTKYGNAFKRLSFS